MDWNRKELKKKAKANLKKNYGKMVVVCFIIAFLASGYEDETVTWQSLDIDISENETLKFQAPTVSGEIGKFLENTGVRVKEDTEKLEEKYKLKGATEGAIAKVINNATRSGSFLLGILTTINQVVFNNKILESTLLIVATILMFLYWYFVRNVLIVGEKRFFLETENYEETKASRVLYLYRTNKVGNVAKIMFFRFLFNLLWFLTIIGGFVKYYEYLMIPYILAENPNISRKEAFALSKEMMRGNKWKTFVLDLSFIPLQFLSLLTFGISNYLYMNPYMTATRTELYYAIREYEIVSESELAYNFNDIYLTDHIIENYDTYPVELYPIPSTRDWLELDYDRDYSLESLIMIFFVMSFVGWLWEVFLYLVSTDGFVNRGTMIGPWLPIYGSGSVIMIILLKRFADKPPLFFVSAFFTCGVLEYATSWVLELLFDKRWWDYTNVFFNINGRVCLEGLLFFAMGGVLIIYLLAPLIDEAFERVEPKHRKIILGILLSAFLVDFAFSSTNPNQGDNITAFLQIGKNEIKTKTFNNGFTNFKNSNSIPLKFVA